MSEKLILIVNPGSSSRKYALYEGGEILAELHFENEGEAVVCNCKTKICKEILRDKIDDLSDSPDVIDGILKELGVLKEDRNIDAIAIRVVAPSEYFIQNRLVDDKFISQLEDAQHKAPLHVSVVLAELKALKSKFTLPIYAISDSAFHATKPKKAQFYAIDTELAQKNEIKRFGYHGLSVGSISHLMKENDIANEKVIVCHLGSGCSISALENGKSVDNSMGYSPLEGVAMATRSGNIDFSAAIALKNALNISLSETEKYLNKQAGLLGLSGISGDLRDVIESAESGNERSEQALEVYVYKIQQEIGKMAAALNGVDSLVFTATIGERSDYLRARIMKNLTFLGFSLDDNKNKAGFDGGNTIEDISAENSKPIYIIKTDESAEIIRQTLKLICR